MTIQRIVKKNIGSSNPSSFVGNSGDVFLDANVPILKLSDGITPGGISLGGGAGTQNLNETLIYGNISLLGMSVGVVTATYFIGNGSLLTNVSNSGYANTAGIATYAKNAGIATYATTAGVSTTSGYATSSGIATYAKNAGIATYATTAGVSTTSGYATSSGIATYATTAGVSTTSGYATSSGIATYATSSGIATYATTAGVSTTSGYATSSGIATYATSSGVSTYATSSGIATYATFSGIATYATSSGVSTSVMGGIASVTQLNVSGVSTLGTVKISSGIITATTGVVTYYGDGSQLTGISSGGGTSSSQWVTTAAGIHTLSNVGIGTTNASSTLTVVGNALISGIITANSFRGDGSQLTGIIGSGIATYATSSGIATYATSSGVSTTSGYATTAGVSTTSGYATSSGIATYATSSGISTYATSSGIATYATSSGIATYAKNAGIATYATSSGISTYATSSGIATYATSSGISTYATSSGIATYATSSGIATYATSSGIATYATSSGIATYATSSGIATYAKNAGIATYATSSGIATYATTAGVSTTSGYATSSGIATYATSSGIATYASTAGISTSSTTSGYATTSGISSTSQGLTGTPNITVGVITATTFSGTATTATNLSNAANITAGTISSSRLSGTYDINITGNATNATTAAGVSTSININTTGSITATSFVGNGSGLTGIVASGSGIIIKDDGSVVGTAGTIDFGSNLSVSAISAGVVTVTATNAGIATYATNAGIATYATNAGIATYASTAGVSTSVIGGIGSITQLQVTGISTFTNGPILVGTPNSTGTANQLLQVNTGGYFRGSVGIGTTNPTSALYVVGDTYVTGIITATSYRGDGSQLTGIVASGSGIIIKDDGSVVGTAGTIDFGSNLSVSAISAGVVTVTASGSGGSGIGTQWVTVSSGIYTGVNVGIGTTVASSTLTVQGTGKFSGIVTASRFDSVTSGVPTIESSDTININAPKVAISTDLYVGGLVGIGTAVASSTLTVQGTGRFSGIVTASRFHSVTSGVPTIESSDTININTPKVAISTDLYVGGFVGVGTTNPTEKLSVVGVVSATSFYGDASNTVSGRWTLGANGSSDYTFTGIGFTQTTNDPVLYLARGRVYEFVNNSGGSHPFQIRASNGGSAYSDGVTNNGAASGVIRFEIPFSSPNTLYYQCTMHSGMGNTISVYPSTI